MITVPPSLSTANAALSLADSLAKLLDPKERQKIADDIKAHHALNESEAKRAEEARSTINQNTDILNQTHQAEVRIVQTSKDLDTEKARFKAEKEAEWAKINIAKGEAKDALEKVQTLHAQAVDTQNKTGQKETELTNAKSEHLENVKKLAADRAALEKEKAEIEAFKKQVLAMEEEARTKLATLKQYNF